VDGEWLRIGIGGVVPIQWDVSKADDPGSLTGWASVYNVIDQQDDVVMPGAFRKTLTEWRSSKRVIPLTLDHQNSAEGVIGSLAKVEDTAYGLKTTFRFADVAKAQDARTLARDGHLNGLSIWGPIFAKSFETVAGKSVRILREVGLRFVGLTPIPANDSSLVLTAKVDDKTPGLPEAWVTDMRAALSIGSPQVRKNAVDQLVVMQYRPGNAPAGTTEPNKDGGTGPASAPDPDDASKYALAIIGQSGPGSSPPGGEPTDSLAELLAHTEATTVSHQLDALAAELGKE
jgi:hypothetical protein